MMLAMFQAFGRPPDIEYIWMQRPSVASIDASRRPGWGLARASTMPGFTPLEQAVRPIHLGSSGSAGPQPARSG